MLGILNTKIYNLDTKDYKVQKWSELENVRYFYDFFKSRKNEFEKWEIAKLIQTIKFKARKIS